MNSIYSELVHVTDCVCIHVCVHIHIDILSKIGLPRMVVRYAGLRELKTGSQRLSLSPTTWKICDLWGHFT